MKQDKVLRRVLLWMLPLLALLLMVLIWGQLTAYRSKQVRVVGDMRKLQRLQVDQEREMAAREIWWKMPDPPPDFWGGLVSTGTFSGRLEYSRSSRTPAGDGWIVWRHEIGFADAAFSNAVQLIQMAESASPPWRLVQCSVRASAVAGQGRMAMTFETRARASKP